MGSVAKACIICILYSMRKGFLIYEEMGKFLTIYDFATDPFGISLYTRKILFYFLSVYPLQPEGSDGGYLLWANPTHCKQISICVFPKQIYPSLNSNFN